jgi:lysozyme
MSKLEDMLIRHEGLKLMPYRCTAGKLTIGIGRNIQDRGINEAEARIMCQNDIQEITARLVKYSWFTRLCDVRKDVIVDMAFMGVQRLLGFKKMIEALSREDYKAAAAEMLESKWAKQVGARATELASMMVEGRYIK